MLDKDVKYCLNDKCIVPAVMTGIESRSECYPYYISDNIVMLPIFAAPMNCVTDATNYNTWVEHGIQAIMPRTVPWETRCWAAENGKWVAMSQKEFYNYFVSDARVLRGPAQTYRICIDTANAHRQSIYEMAKAAKVLANGEYNIKIMVGNIANPDTYKYITENYPSIIDYIRVSIGTGSGCFVAGTNVTLSDGSKTPVEDIEIGDKVLTIDGSEQTVESILSYFTDKNIIKINNEISCTDNHKFFVINKSDKDICTEDNLEKLGFWVEAKNLDKNKHLLIKRYR